ncbi:MAG: CDP-diacylglycerol--glycerol-3-phosphate 3-phosphatidyltransferase [Oligoflexia bacterium]|nr:CDP-diacylglycerol--glycerol-3-phosphate 3-phosphatidyltransferase [Oligoflexia bacterium]
MSDEQSQERLNPQPSAQPPAQIAQAPAPHVHDELTFNTTPNHLSLLRMAFVPVVVGLLYVQKPTWDIIAALAFGVASITDWYDGYLARKFKVVTVYGKLLDPLADKFLVVSTIIMLQHLHRIHPILVMLLINRELAITGLRALASAEGVIISASDSAKWKTGTQMVAIPFLMVQSALFGLPLGILGSVLIYFSLAISLWSAKDYVVGFFKGVKEKHKLRSHERRLAREAHKASRTARLMARLARHAKQQPE